MLSAVASETESINMGYHITLQRPESSPGITAREWKEFVLSRPELQIVEEDRHFIPAILDGDGPLALHYSTGSASMFTKNPDGPRILEYMTSIAPHLGGVVLGDEGEPFSTEADCGTRNDWGTPTDAGTEENPWWQRELSRGKRVIAGLLLGTLVFIIVEVIRSR